MNGLMVEDTKVNGKIIKWKEMEDSSGLMAENMREIILMIKSMVMECLNGQMEENIRDNGLTENKKEKVFI